MMETWWKPQNHGCFTMLDLRDHLSRLQDNHKGLRVLPAIDTNIIRESKQYMFLEKKTCASIAFILAIILDG
jgi:translation initiation factor 2 beta subunit (eIF-2beta)/eIF-5